MKKLTYKTIIFMLVTIMVCSSVLTLLAFNLKPVIVGERIEYGIKYSLPDGLELYRGVGPRPFYVLAQKGGELDEIDGIIKLQLDENLNPETTSVLRGPEPQLSVTLKWENREIIGISRYRADESIIIDKDGDGMADIRNIREFPDGPLRGREIFFEGQWVPVIIKEETFNVKLPDDKVVPVEFSNGKWGLTED